MIPFTRREFLRLAAASGATAVTAGCGTILHPERRGQPAGRLDWEIVALNAIGLFFFFIPGVIAFAVDFSNGTIYLPPEHYGEAFPPKSRRLKTVHVPQARLTRDGIADAVSTQTGRHVRLVEGTYETRELARIEEFWPTHETLRDA